MASFRNRFVRQPISGTRTSPQTAQLITSSGNPSLDVLLGGGLPIRSICLIEEDEFAVYSKVLAKYFMAEGVLSRHSIFLGSLNDSPKEFIHKLPQHCADTVEEEIPEVAENGLRIAWRYNDLPIVNSEEKNIKIGHHFNLMEVMNPKEFDYVTTHIWSDDVENDGIVVNENVSVTDASSTKNKKLQCSKNSTPPNPQLSLKDKQDPEDHNVELNQTESSLFHCTKYFGLLTEVRNFLRYFVGSLVCRVCITSLGSPEWYHDHFDEDILKFLTILRAVIRSYTSVCFITLPMHLIAKYDETLVSKIRNLVDYSIELKTFAGSDKETNPGFKEYNGLVKLHKISAVNTLRAYMPESTDLAFKLKRKIFIIENLHLPPELQDDSTHKEDAKPTLSCGSNISSDLNLSWDF